MGSLISIKTVFVRPSHTSSLFIAVPVISKKLLKEICGTQQSIIISEYSAAPVGVAMCLLTNPLLYLVIIECSNYVATCNSEQVRRSNDEVKYQSVLNYTFTRHK